MLVASWNVNSLKVRLEHVIHWLADVQPDVLCLQETKTVDEQFPAGVFEDLGYHIAYAGQKTYNGVAIISRHEISDVVVDFPDFDDPQRRILAATINGVRIVNLYVPNGGDLGSEKFQYKLKWLSHLEAWLEQVIEKHTKTVVLGDFNIAPRDCDVHDIAAWEGGALVSPQERAVFERLLGLGLSDTFTLFEPDETIYSWWDYRAAGFQRNSGLRIDLILSSKILAEQCSVSYIDIEPRKLERPSDHAPVLASFDPL
jgi:exodeoxyribonuclease-3